LKYIILPILVIAVLLLFPQRVYCASNVNISFIEYDEYGNHWFSRMEIPINSRLHIYEQTNAALSYLFALDKPTIYPYPSGIHLIETHYIEGYLAVFLYIPHASFGGSMLERIYLGQILKTLLDLDGVEKVSIIADTPKGLNVREKRSWHELFYGIVATCDTYSQTT